MSKNYSNANNKNQSAGNCRNAKNSGQNCFKNASKTKPRTKGRIKRRTKVRTRMTNIEKKWRKTAPRGYYFPGLFSAFG